MKYICKFCEPGECVLEFPEGDGMIPKFCPFQEGMPPLVDWQLVEEPTHD